MSVQRIYCAKGVETVDFELSSEQMNYIHRLACRYVKYRKSNAIDVDDLKSAASIRWWRYVTQNPWIEDADIRQRYFYQHVKGAMRDLVRDSNPVKVTRTMQANTQKYVQPYTVELEHVIDVYAGDPISDREGWLDVLSCLQKLPERDQIILSLYYEQGFNFSEIAEIMEVSVSTITRSYRKILDHLKKDLQKSAKEVEF